MDQPRRRIHLDATGAREVVYCHMCRHEWFRDSVTSGSLDCPSCHSSITEIVTIGPDDPRFVVNQPTPRPERRSSVRPMSYPSHLEDQRLGFFQGLFSDEMPQLRPRSTRSRRSQQPESSHVGQQGQPGQPDAPHDPERSTVLNRFQEMLLNNFNVAAAGRSDHDTLFPDAPQGPGPRIFTSSSGLTTGPNGLRVAFSFNGGGSFQPGTTPSDDPSQAFNQYESLLPSSSSTSSSSSSSSLPSSSDAPAIAATTTTTTTTTTTAAAAAATGASTAVSTAACPSPLNPPFNPLLEQPYTSARSLPSFLQSPVDSPPFLFLPPRPVAPRIVIITRISTNPGLRMLGAMLGVPPPPPQPGADGQQGERIGADLGTLVMALLGGHPALNGVSGDAVYSQEAMDRIVSQLMEQTQSSNAPPPASEDAIKKLTRKKLDTDMLPEGKGDCSICLQDVVVDEEVVVLPCTHWFHDECITHWLAEHGTCPICRKTVDASGRRAGAPNMASGASTSANPVDNDSGPGRFQQQPGEAPGGARGPAFARYAVANPGSGAAFTRFTILPPPPPFGFIGAIPGNRRRARSHSPPADQNTSHSAPWDNRRSVNWDNRYGRRADNDGEDLLATIAPWVQRVGRGIASAAETIGNAASAAAANVAGGNTSPTSSNANRGSCRTTEGAPGSSDSSGSSGASASGSAASRLDSSSAAANTGSNPQSPSSPQSQRTRDREANDGWGSSALGWIRHQFSSRN